MTKLLVRCSSRLIVTFVALMTLQERVFRAERWWTTASVPVQPGGYWKPTNGSASSGGRVESFGSDEGADCRA